MHRFPGSSNSDPDALDTAPYLLEDRESDLTLPELGRDDDIADRLIARGVRVSTACPWTYAYVADCSSPQRGCRLAGPCSK